MFTSSPLVQSAGGELIKLPGNDFYLVMGHVFSGTYTAFEGQGEKNRESVSQVYLNEIRRLKIECGDQDRLNRAPHPNLQRRCGVSPARSERH